jgi:Spy/CpxP family protein refolding chaperone
LKSRFSRLIFAVLLIAGFAATSLAQEAPEGRRLARHRFPRCLLVLDLTEEQRTQIHAILQTAGPVLREDLAALAVSRDALRAALDAEPADACTVGEAALGVEASLQALKAAKEALKDQIAAVLTPEQIARFEGCLDAPFGDDSVSGLEGRNDDVNVIVR